MEEKKKEQTRLARVLRHLRMQGKISSDKDFADKVGTTATTVSRNKNSGNPFDEKIMRGVYKAFGDIINIDYLRGESDVMLVKDLPSGKEEANAALQEMTPLHANCNDLMNVAIAAKDEVISSKDETIAALRGQLANTIADKDKIIAANEALIKNLQQTVARLTADLAMEKGLSTGTSPSAPAEPEHRQGKNA